MKMQAWDVLLKVSGKFEADSQRKVHLPFGIVTAHLTYSGVDSDYYHIDTVFFDSDMGSASVRRSLVDHDGYPDNIVARKA